MAWRMVPVGTVFRRFPRVVRDLAARFGKTITLQYRRREYGDRPRSCRRRHNRWHRKPSSFKPL